jgi:hypothetical protein
MSIEQFEALANVDGDAVKQEEVVQIDALGALWLADNVSNQPIRRNSQTLVEEIGPGTFSKARAAWESLRIPTSERAWAGAFCCYLTSGVC